MFTSFKVSILESSFARSLDRTLRSGDIVRLVVDDPSASLTLLGADRSPALVLEPSDANDGKHPTDPLYAELVRQLGVDDTAAICDGGADVGVARVEKEMARHVGPILAEIPKLSEMDRFVGRHKVLELEADAMRGSFGRARHHDRSLLANCFRGHAFVDGLRAEMKAEAEARAIAEEAERIRKAGNTRSLRELGCECIRLHLATADIGSIPLPAAALVRDGFSYHVFRRLDGWEAPPGAQVGSMTFVDQDEILPFSFAALELVQPPSRDVVGVLLRARERDMQIDTGPIDGWSDDPADEVAALQGLREVQHRLYGLGYALDPHAYLVGYRIEWAVRFLRVQPDVVAELIVGVVAEEHRKRTAPLVVPTRMKTLHLSDGTQRVEPLDTQEIPQGRPMPAEAWDRVRAETAALAAARTGTMSPRPFARPESTTAPEPKAAKRRASAPREALP